MTTLYMGGNQAVVRPIKRPQDTATFTTTNGIGTSLDTPTTAPGVSDVLTRSTQAGPVTDPGLLAGTSYWWVSAPLAADVTISGSATVVTSGFESNAMANCGLRLVVWRIPANGDSSSVIINSLQAAELGTSSARTSRSVTPTSTSLVAGDMLAFAVYVDDLGGNMASGHTVTANFGGSAGGTSELSVAFAETLTFASAPSGTTLRAKYTTAHVAGFYDLDTAAGDGSSNYAVVTTTAAAEDLIAEWISEPLAALTNVSGRADLQVGALVETGATGVALSARLYKVDGNGSSNRVLLAEGRDNAALTTGVTNMTFSIPVGKFSLADGQRLILQINATASPTTAKATGYDVSVNAGNSTYEARITLPFTVTASGPTTVNASVGFNGGGTLSATGVATKAATAAFTQATTLTATGAVVKAATAAFTQSETLTATGTVQKPATATFNATSTLTATGVVGTSVAFHATATLTATGVRVILASAALTASHTLTASATQQFASTVAFTATGTLTATATRIQPASVTLTSTATLTATGVVSTAAVFAAVGKLHAFHDGVPLASLGWHTDPVNTWSWFGFGYAYPGGTVKEIDEGVRFLWRNDPPQVPTGNPAVGLGFTSKVGHRYTIRAKIAGVGPRIRLCFAFYTSGAWITPTLTPTWYEYSYDETVADLRRPGLEGEGPANGYSVGDYLDVVEFQIIEQRVGGPATFNGGGTLTASGTRVQPATAAFTQDATLAATAVRQPQATVAFTQGATLTAAPATIGTSVALTASETLTATGVRQQPATVALTAQETLTASAVRQVPATAAFTAQGTLTATGTVVKVGTVAFTQDATLTALWSASGVVNANVAFTQPTTLTVSSFVQRFATAAFTASETLTATGTRVQPATVALHATHTLTSTATVTLPAVAVLAAGGTLTATGQVLLSGGTVTLTETHTLVAEATVTYGIYALDPADYPGAHQQFRYADPTRGPGRLLMRYGVPATRKTLLLFQPSAAHPLGRVVVSTRSPVGSGWDADYVITTPETFRTNSHDWKYDVLTNNGYDLVLTEA